MNFTIYNTQTGQIEKQISCPNEQLALQFDSQTQTALEGIYDESSVYIEAGTPVNMPVKPSEFHTFDYALKAWVDLRTVDAEWATVRAERNRRLLASDWTQLPDVPAYSKEAWALYREALRSITEQANPFNIVWPTSPQ